ncbi:MAG: TrmB family transcriptional regulator sugar-binding domain-containing protein [Infirmifilum sp.]
MSEEDVLSRLMKLGFTKYEANAYLALLKHGTLTSTEILKLARIPQPRIYDVMDNLVSKGLVRKSKGKPIRYTLVEPSLAFKAFIDAEVSRMQIQLEGIIEFYRNRELLSSATKEDIWISHGYSAYSTAVREAVLKAEDELLLAVYGATLSTMLRSEEIVSKLESLSTCLIIYDQEPGGQLPFEEVLYKPTFGPTLFIADLSKAWLVTGFPNGKEPTVYYIEDPELMGLVTMYFFDVLRRWSKAVSVRLGRELREQRFRSIARAVDMVRILQDAGSKVRVTAEGFWVKTREKGTVEGYVVGIRREELRGITSIDLLTADGARVSIGGLGARYEDFEAHRIRVSAD